ncbi:MAG: hypothetical protein ACTHO8_09025 [Solirubrobacterales bacterium]
MKHLKMLSLAAAGAAAMMALVGAGTASATVFCKVEAGSGLCPAEAYPAGQEIHAALSSGAKAKLQTEFMTAECSESTIQGKTSSEERAPLGGSVSTLSFSGCNCEVKVLNAGTISTEWIEGTNNGTLTSSGSEITTVCGGVDCVYKTENTDLGTLTGGNPATLDVSAKIPRAAPNIFCAEKALWEAKYEFATPKPLYVSQKKASFITIPSNGSTITFTKPKDIQKAVIENTGNAAITVGVEVIANGSLFKHVTACGGKSIPSGKTGNTCTMEIECLASGETDLTIPVNNLGQSVIKLKCD